MLIHFVTHLLFQMRKHIMKALKGKIVSILQTYNGRMFMMALFESVDDTKALNKVYNIDFLKVCILIIL